MRQRFVVDPWKIVETAFAPQDLRFSESLFSLGNGAMGTRGNFEEQYSGDTHRGAYIGGVWFPDKTRVGWWKNGYPAYFGKVINAVNLLGVDIAVDGVALDAAVLPVEDFHRQLDMRRGLLQRSVTYRLEKGTVQVQWERFASMKEKHLLAIAVAVTPSFAATVEITPYLDGNVHNEDSNYGEVFWDQQEWGIQEQAGIAWVSARTRENPFDVPRFLVAAAFGCETAMPRVKSERRSGYAAISYRQRIQAGNSAALQKMVCVATDRDYPLAQTAAAAQALARQALQTKYRAALTLHEEAWARKWESADVQIEGDAAAQQGIRFNLFQLLCTYTGEDARLNIGPKGFTGEKYGGATYWDTEAYCFPVYLAIAGASVSRQLLIYRHRQLSGAYHNAAQQGLGGALYPMVTFNGIECHNEWEITFEEIHRNAAIAHAIFYYTSYTGDEEYLTSEGLEVLAAIARFWAGRVHYQPQRGQYMIHGVTGPNEYENNVNNNWYTNRMAAWCLEFAGRAAHKAGPKRCQDLNITQEELSRWQTIAANMYYPADGQRGIFVQHDTFLDKDLQPASAIPAAERPINQHWSWDRILRSCYIKQADVLQAFYFLGHLYDDDTVRRNFDFYEPMTVHESSLSPCVHAILAARLGDLQTAMAMYRRTARLDLDDVNHDTRDGLHITSMSGSWLAIAQGFAGMRTAQGLSFAPLLPEGWQSYSFRFNWRERVILLKVSRRSVTLRLEAGMPASITVYGQEYALETSLTILREKA